MFEEAASLSTWLTPTVLFILLNLVIFSIAFTSGGFSSHHQPPQLQPQLSRSLSILHRLKSINFYDYIPSPQQIQIQLHHHDPPPKTTADETENRLTSTPDENLTSGGFSSHHHQPPQLHPQLSRSLSILHRLKSINFYDYIPSPQQIQIQLHHHDPPPKATADETENRLTSATEEELTSVGFSSHHHQPPQLQPQLSRSLSILHRLKSINFYDYIPSPQQLQIHLHHHDPPLKTTADETENRLTSAPDESLIVEKEEEEDTASHHLTPAAEDETIVDEEGPTMDEVYSRIIQSNGNSYANYGRQNSDTKPAGGEVPVRLPRKMKKSASDKSTFNHFGAAAVVEAREKAAAEEEEVDARADNFINKFRQQLKMQRLNSILRYKEMISKVCAK